MNRNPNSFALEEHHPDAILLDVRFGEYDTDRFVAINIKKS